MPNHDIKTLVYFPIHVTSNIFAFKLIEFSLLVTLTGELRIHYLTFRGKIPIKKMCPGFNTKLYFMVRVMFRSYGKFATYRV